MRLQLLCDYFADFALNCEYICQVASIGLDPKVRVIASIDQLRIHPHFAGDSLDTAFQHVSNPQRLTDFSQVTRGLSPVLVYTGAADYFQVGDLSKVCENFI